MRLCSRSAAGVCATVRAGFAGLRLGDGEAVWNRLISPQAERTRAAHSKAGAAQRRRPFHFPRRPANPATLATRVLSGRLIPTEQLNLPYPKHFDPRAAPRLDPAPNANPSIFERLKAHPGRLEGRYRAP